MKLHSLTLSLVSGLSWIERCFHISQSIMTDVTKTMKASVKPYKVS